MARKWPVVRREAEHSTIRSVLAGQSDVGGIVLIGDAGVGKTTLARLVTRSLSCPVHWVAGTESARSIPLAVFAPFIGSATPPDPVAYLAAARETLLADEQCVIGVDDAHLLDQLSATLLHQLGVGGGPAGARRVGAGLAAAADPGTGAADPVGEADPGQRRDPGD